MSRLPSLGAAILPHVFLTWGFPSRVALASAARALLCTQEGDRRMKLQNMVKFPLSGLDMTPHVVKRSQSSWSLPSHWSPWRKPYGLGRDPEDYIYDLYAVCNHHGTMQGGHYTGKCPAVLSVGGLSQRSWLYFCMESERESLMEECHKLQRVK